MAPQTCRSHSHRRFDHAYDHPHDGGLASSIGAKETEQLARLHFEVYVFHCCEIAEPLGQVLNFDGVTKSPKAPIAGYSFYGPL